MPPRFEDGAPELTTATAGCFELLDELRVTLGRVLDRPAHARILHFLRPLALLVRHGAAGGRGGGEFSVGELERHVRIVAPPGARVHAVRTDARDWIAWRPAFGRPLSG